VVGKEVRAVATLTEFTERKLVTTVEVWNDKTLVGEGVVVQAVMPKEFINQRIREMNEA
jgi:predicted thioesterase